MLISRAPNFACRIEHDIIIQAKGAGRLGASMRLQQHHGPYLQDAHAKGVAEDSMSLIVVAESYAGGCHK